jgi:hypothetical protein
MLLAAVLVVGFIGLSSTPSSIFAQYYDDYESEYSQYYDDDYEKYMKKDDSKPIIDKIICNNINNNPSDNNVDTSNALGFSNENSQLGQRDNQMNTEERGGNFVSICQNNDNLNIINPTLIINNGTTITNNTLSIGNNNPNNQTIDLSLDACSNEIDVANFTQANSAGDSSNQSNSISISASQANDCEVTAIQSNLTQSIQDNSTNTGVITVSSIDNGEQPQAQTQQVKLLQDGNGVEINQKGDLPIDIQQIKSSNNDNGIEIQQQGNLPMGITQQLENSNEKDSSITSQSVDDSSDLTAMEKVTKLKTQWLNQLP